MKHRFLALALSAVLTLSLLPVSAGAAGFRDVPSNSALAGEVAKANSYGLMAGYNATTFGYADSMTRAQFVTVLSRMMNWGGSTAGGSTHGVTEAMALPAGISDTYFAAISAAASGDARSSSSERISRNIAAAISSGLSTLSASARRRCIPPESLSN